MPFERDGKLLEIGDIVYVTAEVVALGGDDELLNVELKTSTYTVHKDKERVAFKVNSYQVVKGTP